ncbi:hypothetical protein P879_05962 [Paragonimus westermani]|uniref:Uncharacterized protein n=1 Tax=Paragonimus westermani TaxID=34504 RepID=A0A8T0D6L5_9TREM|nr:hypothetical protein P879_05962 [Paragonimus westermani]
MAEVERVRMRSATGFQQFSYALPFPFPYLLVLIGIGYLGLLGMIWLIYHLRRRHVTSKTRPLVQLSQFPCSTCCVSFAELCNCCRMTSLDACLNGLCPQRRSHDCADLLLCQACLGRPGRLRKSIPLVRCPVLCQSAYCEDTTLCCFYCEFRAKPLVPQPEQ